MQPALPPIFVKANLSFSIGGKPFYFPGKGVSIYGVAGLPWTHFDPTDKVGTPIQVTVDVLARVKYQFTTMAVLTAETTSDSIYIGMKFRLNDFERVRLATVIRNEGYYPTEYIRKYPRIPAQGVISSMPLRAIAVGPQEDLIAFDIANMSPSGILLYTENPRSSLFLPASRIEAQVEPRGENFAPFNFEGLVCRVVTERNLESKNVSRYFGIKFLKIDESQKQNFLDILRAVLNNIQNDHKAKS